MTVDSGKGVRACRVAINSYGRGHRCAGMTQTIAGCYRAETGVIGWRTGRDEPARTPSAYETKGYGMEIPDSHTDLLNKKGFAHVATIGPRGEPQSNPVWYDWDGRFIKVSQTTTRQKYRNIQREPRIALSVVDPENPYHYLEIRGRVDHVEEDPDKAFINAMAKKYMDLDTYPYTSPEEQRIVVFIRPERTTGM